MCATAVAQFSAPPGFLLPDDVKPRKYTVDLTIDPSLPVFSGVISINVDAKAATRIVWMNAQQLEVQSADASFNGRRISSTRQTLAGEFVGIELNSPIGPGNATISIRYQGKLDEKSVVGPYRKKVGDDWYVFTTFTPIDARRAFPCFDEPRFKAPWKLTIHTRRELQAFSNGREDAVIDEPGGMKAVHFVETKPLPTEVVAFAVGPFDVMEGAAAGHGTPIRVITTRGLASQGQAAAQATVDVLPRLEAYTGMPYAFGKLDHIALPEGAFGAVENPGLITYRQMGLLAAPGTDTPEKIRAIRSIEAHEMAHQWFGDLVTQATWTDVWLSEGFATWLSAKIMDEFEPPERKHVNAVASRERIMAHETDPGARPVRLAMNSREDTRGVYGRMVYDKGAAILLMMEGWLGEDKVRDGLRAYLKKHAFANASTADLESALTAASGVDPSRVMDSFLDRVGVPVIHAECSGGKVTVDAPVVWSIPVCVRGDGMAQTCGVIEGTHHVIELKRACPAWIYLNSGATGYYRSAYTAAQQAALRDAPLTAAEQATLGHDIAALNVK
jgi:cytosol alanyl aminopeptidase